MTKSLNSLLSPALSSVHPYVPGEQKSEAGWIKLNTNESAFGPSEMAIHAMREVLSDGMRLYPDPRSASLKKVIAECHDVDASQVFVGNGSDEVLGHAFLAFFRQPNPVLMPDITYNFYASYCGLYGISRRAIPLTRDFEIDLSADTHVNGGVVFPNPNAPTGRAIERGCLDAFLRTNRGSVVLVDEAYVDFGAQSAIPLLDRHPHLLVVQTLSKSRSLAGLRVGFALGHPELIAAMERVKDSFNAYPLGRVPQAGAAAAISDTDHLRRVVEATSLNRERLTTALSALGFIVVPSAANFIFVRHQEVRGPELEDGLRRQRILVRRFDQPRIQDYLRITIGTEAHCEALRSALARLV